MISDLVLTGFALIFMLVGLKKGFMRSVISLMGVIITLFLTIWLAKPFCDFLSGFLPFHSWFQAPLIEKFSAIEALNIPIPSTVEGMNEALVSANVPSFIAKLIAPTLLSMVPTVAEGVTTAILLGDYVGGLIALVVSGIALFILIRIALAIIERLVKKLANVPIIRVVDKTLGLAFGALKCYIIVLMLLTVVSLMSNVGFMKPVIANINESKVVKVFYEHNFINDFLFRSKNKEKDTTASPDPNATEQTGTAKVEYLTYAARNGEQYQFVLADGD